MSTRLDYGKVVAKLNLNLPNDFWSFWKYYYTHPTEQKQIQQSSPYFNDYTILLNKIHNAASKFD